MGKYKLPWNNFVPQTFGDAVAYEQQIKYLAQRLQKIEEEGMPTPDLTDLKRRVTELETEVLTIQNELQELDVEAVTARLAAVDEAITALETEQAAQSVEVTSHGNRLTALESTVETQQGTVDNLSGRVATTDQAVNRLADDLTQVTQAVAGKQDKLTAGANITIENNVISSTGGGGSVILDTEVTEDSQHAVTSEGIYNAIQTAKTAVETQHTTDINRINGELAGKASTASVTALRTDVEGDISRIETEYKAADGEIDTRLDNLEASQTATDESVATLNTNVSNLQQTQSSQGTTLTGLGNRMTTAEGNITQLQTDTSQLSGTVQGMQTTIQGKQDKLTAGANITIENNIISATGGGGGGQVTLDDTVTETSSNGVKSSGIYTAIETAKSGLQESITDIDGRVDTLESDNTTNKSNISTLQSSVASAQDDIGALQTGLQQEASDREAADQALRVSINGNSSAINTLRTNTNASITQLQTDVAGKQDKLTAGSNITIENNVISSSGGGSSASVVRVDSESDYQTQKDNITSALAVKDVFSNSGMVSATRLPAGVVDGDSTARFIVPYRDGETASFGREEAEIYVINRKQDEYQLKNGRGFTTTVGRNNHSVAISPNWDAPWIAVIDNDTQRSTPSSMGMSSAPDNARICRYIPVTTRVTTTSYYSNLSSESFFKWYNINGRIMKGYAVYQADLTGYWPKNLLGIMWVDRSNSYSPSYDQTGDLISCHYECTAWDRIADVNSEQARNPLVIVPIF